MTLVVKVAGVTLAEGAISMPGPNSNLPGGVQGLPASAWYGEPMHASIIIDDPLGEYDFDLPWQTLTVDETDCAKPRMFTGWLTARSISRGPYRSGAGRVWECDIVDQNALFSFEVFRASSAKRPAETDIARVAFAITSGPMAGTPVFDNGRANLIDNPVNFTEADYVTQFPVEVFVSVAGTSGKNFYAYWDDVAGEISLYYDLIANFPASTLRISNVIGDVDNDETFYPYRDAAMVRDPQNVYTGELLGYRGAYVYVRRQATIDAIGSSAFSPNNFLRDIVRSTDRIGSAATATSVATSDLERLATDSEKITVTVQLPSTHVNLIMAGEQVDGKFTHLPGLEDFTGLNVIRRNVVPTRGRTDFYDLHLELSNTGDVRGTGGGGVVILPHRPCSSETGELVQASDWTQGSLDTLTIDLPAAPVQGNLLVLYLWSQTTELNGGDTLDDWTHDGWTNPLGGLGYLTDDDTSIGVPEGSASMLLYRIVESGDTDSFLFEIGGDVGSQVTGQIAEFQGPLAFGILDTIENSADQSSGSVYVGTAGAATPPTPGIPTLVIGASHIGLAANSSGFVPDWSPSFNQGTILGIQVQDVNHNAAAWAYLQGPSAGTSLIDMNWSNGRTTGIAHGEAGFLAIFQCAVADDPPATGVTVHRETVAEGDGTTTVFTTNWPYADGSLRVFVDGVEILNGLTESDPATGEFTLDFAPLGAIGDSRAEIVTATYQGR